MTAENRWTFAIATPDAILGGYLGFVLERLAAAGLEVRASRVIGLDMMRLARMYSHEDDPEPPVDARGMLPPSVMTPLYRLAPAVALVLRRAEGDACAALLRMKGATKPHHAAPGTIRAAGEHEVFNFLHCPDDPEAAWIELGYLLGPELAAAGRALAEAGAPEPASALLAPARLPLVLPVFGGPEALSFPFTANRLRRRLVHDLALARPEAGSALASVDALLGEERAALEAAASPAARLAVAVAANPAIHEALVAVKGPSAALEALAQLYDPAGTRRFQAIRDLPTAGHYVSEAELVALDAHRHTFWRPEDPEVDMTG